MCPFFFFQRFRFHRNVWQEHTLCLGILFFNSGGLKLGLITLWGETNVPGSKALEIILHPLISQQNRVGITRENSGRKPEPRKERENIGNNVTSALGLFTDSRKLMFIFLISWGKRNRSHFPRPIQGGKFYQMWSQLCPGLAKDSTLRLRMNQKSTCCFWTQP